MDLLHVRTKSLKPWIFLVGPSTLGGYIWKHFVWSGSKLIALEGIQQLFGSGLNNELEWI